MEYYSLQAFILEDSSWYNVEGKDYKLYGKFEYLTWYKTTEKTNLWSWGTKGLLAFNVPAFCQN